MNLKALNLLKEDWIKNNVIEKFVAGKTPVPVSGKVIGFEEVQNMIESSLEAWLTAGHFNKEFEKKIADKTLQ